MGVQEFRSSGVQEFRSSGVQEFRSTEVLESWNTGSVSFFVWVGFFWLITDSLPRSETNNKLARMPGTGTPGRKKADFG
jgi:hypothetical protein